MTNRMPLPAGLALTLQDAAMLADHWGEGRTLGTGEAMAPDADILLPAADLLQPREVLASLRRGLPNYHFSFGNQVAAPSCRIIGPVLETLISASGTGFMAACLAHPRIGRTVYQGHLFQGGHLRDNLATALAGEISGRIGLVPQDVTAAGAPAIRARLSALKDQGYALALVDAVEASQCAAIATAFAGLTVTGGPAWVNPGRPDQPASATAADPSPLAILSGALDRHTLFQIGAAASRIPVLQLDFTGDAKGVIAGAMVWASRQSGSFLIAASAPPGQIQPGAPAKQVLAEIAAGLAARGVKRFLLTGNRSAAAILRHLGAGRFTTGARHGALRAWHADGTTFFIKPAHAVDRNLFLDQIEPYSCLNAAAEYAS